MTGVQTCALPIYTTKKFSNIIKYESKIKENLYSYMPIKKQGQAVQNIYFGKLQNKIYGNKEHTEFKKL